MDRKPVTKEDIAVLAKVTRLNLAENRTQLQADTMNGIFQMLDALDDGNLGETAPSIAFHATWDSKAGAGN